jgi:hypothetical protein
MIRPDDGLLEWKEDPSIEHIENLDSPINQYSPWHRSGGSSPPHGSEGFVDSYYGLAYSCGAGDIQAIYGVEEEFPEFSCDKLANNGFLRVPFRRVPRCLIRMKRELLEIVNGIRSADPTIKVQYRGQRKEHAIPRSDAAKEFLYGKSSTIEPSLIPSGLRKPVAVDHILPEWCLLLRQFYREFLDGFASWASEGTIESSRREARSFFLSPGLLLFGLALAQHYGFPTSGLDVTMEIEVALFFALFEPVKTGPNRSAYVRPCPAQEPAVIYLLAPSEGQTFDYDSFKPKAFPKGRPEAQNAHFISLGWGKNRNACARRTFLALYLDPEGDFKCDCVPSDLFPADDRFAKFLYEASQKDLPSDLERAFQEFYMVDL